jgi:hypothetical protein
MRRGIVLLAGLALLGALIAAGPVTAKPSRAAWHAKHKGELDCNGFSNVQKPVTYLQCVEFHGIGSERPEDNGHYVGHDEPGIQFLSNKSGSGNAMSYDVTLPREPAAKPNGSYKGPVWTFQLSIAPWFGLVMCDTQSWPEGGAPCPRDSDKNIQVPPAPDHAGSAYMELQLYPPGYSPRPFLHKISCDRNHWCSAMTIDSLQFNFDFSNQNLNCAEPVNFAFLTHDGKPVGPPGPDQANESTFTPTPDVLLMNRGDRLHIEMHDTAKGFVTSIDDLTTGTSGAMTASVANGFRHINWDPVNHTCIGSPYAFHPMYATSHTYTHTATADNQPMTWAGWTAHTWNVAYQMEIGHFEKKDGDSDDAFCFDGPTIPGCLGTDDDFDGYPYHKDWPNGSPNFPTPMLVHSPVSTGPHGEQESFNKIQFETDMPAIEAACDVTTGQGCTNPPEGAKFYPWFHLSVPSCQWTLSNDIPGFKNYGGLVKAWGPLEYTDYGGGFVAAENFAHVNLKNPCP